MLSCNTKNRLEIYRGDFYPIVVKFMNTIYTPSENDSIRFGAKRDVYDTVYVIEKNTSDFAISDGKLRFCLTSNETANLEPATYRYDIEITLPNGIVMTVVKNAELVVTGDIVTPEGDE